MTTEQVRRRQFIRELQDEMELARVSSFISGQQIQCLGHVMCRNKEETIRVVLEWIPTVGVYSRS